MMKLVGANGKVQVAVILFLFNWIFLVVNERKQKLVIDEIDRSGKIPRVLTLCIINQPKKNNFLNRFNSYR